MSQASVVIREVGLRDGLQAEKDFVPTEKKLELVEALGDAGVRYLETTSFVSPEAIPQLRDAAELMARVRRGGLVHEVMVPNRKGAQKAIESGADRLIVFISASEAHNQENVRRSIAASLEDLEEVLALAADSGIAAGAAIAVAFGCPYQGRVSRQAVGDIARRLVRAGAERITLADTTGLANPAQIRERIADFREHLPDTALCLHLHNNRGLAMANLYAGYQAGVRMFDASLGGIGGCPNVPRAAGNLATEDVVFLFESMGVDTGIDLTHLIHAARMLEKTLGRSLPGQVMKSGPASPAACPTR